MWLRHLYRSLSPGIMMKMIINQRYINRVYIIYSPICAEYDSKENIQPPVGGQILCRYILTSCLTHDYYLTNWSKWIIWHTVFRCYQYCCCIDIGHHHHLLIIHGLLYHDQWNSSSVINLSYCLARINKVTIQTHISIHAARLNCSLLITWLF